LAAKMLSDGMSVEEAIKRAGYENESFFRKKFKAIYGLSPKEYEFDVEDFKGTRVLAIREKNFSAGMYYEIRME